MAGYNAVPKDVNGVPIAEVYPPGSTGNIVSLQGSTLTTTDAAGNISSPANLNLAQIGSVATQMYTSDGVAYGNVPEVGIGINTGSAVNRLLAASGQADANNGGSGLPNFLWSYTGGGNWDRARTPNVLKKIAAVSITAGTPVSVWTPASGKKFRMMGFILATTVAASILMEDATGGANEFFRVPLLLANTPIASPPLGNGYFSTTANNQLFIDVTVTGVVSGVIYGTEE